VRAHLEASAPGRRDQPTKVKGVFEVARESQAQKSPEAQPAQTWVTVLRALQDRAQGRRAGRVVVAAETPRARAVGRLLRDLPLGERAARKGVAVTRAKAWASLRATGDGVESAACARHPKRRTA
jgi:hypothetical protein